MNLINSVDITIDSLAHNYTSDQSIIDHVTRALVNREAAVAENIRMAVLEEFGNAVSSYDINRILSTAGLSVVDYETQASMTPSSEPVASSPVEPDEEPIPYAVVGELSSTLGSTLDQAIEQAKQSNVQLSIHINTAG